MESKPKWFIIELNEFSNADYSEIYDAVIGIFGEEIDFFIPIHHEQMGSYISKSVLMEGYVFVKNSQSVRDNIYNVKDNRMFNGPLIINGKFQTVDSNTIGSLKRKLKKSTQKKIQTGAQVEILGGTFKKLIGEVLDVEEDGKKVMVKIRRLSREIIAPIPSTMVREVALT